MKILSLEVKNIRGIKHIKISPQGQTLVVFGPNGTGKSAIVDAIDFLLTGKISRLIGEGTKRLSLRKHGCHIDSQNDLKNTVVTAEVEVDGQEALIERSVNKPSSYKVKPSKLKSLIDSKLEVATLGQHILSRREILKYITAEAGKRAKEIQSLLNLMDIENLRATFVTIKNEAKAVFKKTESNFGVEKSEVSILLSLDSFSEKVCLDKVNELRGFLNGSKIKKLSPEKIKDGLEPHPFGAEPDSLTTTQIENTLGETKSLIQQKDTLRKKELEINTLLEAMSKKVKLKQYSVYKELFEAGISLVDTSNVCPLCGRKWEEGDFKTYLEKKIKNTVLGKESQDEIAQNSSFIKNKIDLLRNYVTNLMKAHKQFNLKVNEKELKNYLSSLESWSEAMVKPMEFFGSSKWPTSSLAEIFGASFRKIKIVAPLESTLKKVGDQFSKQQTAWDTLTKMEVKWKGYQRSLEERDGSEVFKKRAEASLEYFEKARDSVLEDIYEAVKDNFNEYYKIIHSEDESSFASKISPKKAQLIFEVDFFGRGMFPPHALHSEGHQDSMGLCLFFALNKYLTKDAIKTIVLDDVIMSIDRTHRRAVCHLLKSTFPDKQFIITTHESAWAKQLKAEGVVTQKNMIHFLNWNIDTGPIFELDKDLWDRIKEDLDKNDIPSAAHKLRRDAEYFFESVCDLLSAKLKYKGHHQWELGDFAPAAISAYKEYLKKGKSTFQKMKQHDKFKKLSELEKSSNEVIGRSQIEQWVINENVHYNRWEEFTKKDFDPVVAAFKALFDLFTCSSCGTTISLSESKGVASKSLVSCGCGKIFWNIE